MTASEATTLRIDRDELRAAGRRAHHAGKLTDEQLRRIEALCAGELEPSAKPTVDVADGSISSALDLDEVDVEWVNVPFPQGGLVSSPPPPMPIGEISAEWLSDSVVIDGERSAEWLSDSVVIDGNGSGVFLGDSAVIEAEASSVVLGDSAVLEARPVAWLGDSAVVEAEASAVVLGDSAVRAAEVSAEWNVPPGDNSAEWEEPAGERSADWNGVVVAAPAAVIRPAFESVVPSEEWPPSVPSVDLSHGPVARRVPVAAYDDDSESPSQWAARHDAHWDAAPASDCVDTRGPVQNARFFGDDGAGREDEVVTNHPEGWAHVGTNVAGRVDGPLSESVVTRPPAVLAAVRAPSPRRVVAAPRFEPLEPAPRVEPASPQRIALRNGTLLSAQGGSGVVVHAPTKVHGATLQAPVVDASVSGVAGFAPLRAGTKMRQPLRASEASGVLASDIKKPEEDPTSISARYPWLAPVLFAAALVLGLIGEWMISTPAAPPVAVAAPKVDTANVVQPASVATPAISLVAAPANVR